MDSYFCVLAYARSVIFVLVASHRGSPDAYPASLEAVLGTKETGNALLFALWTL